MKHRGRFSVHPGQLQVTQPCSQPRFSPWQLPLTHPHLVLPASNDASYPTQLPRRPLRLRPRRSQYRCYRKLFADYDVVTSVGMTRSNARLSLDSNVSPRRGTRIGMGVFVSSELPTRADSLDFIELADVLATGWELVAYRGGRVFIDANADGAFDARNQLLQGCRYSFGQRWSRSIRLAPTVSAT